MDMEASVCYPKPGGKDHSKQVSKRAVLSFLPSRTATLRSGQTI